MASKYSRAKEERNEALTNYTKIKEDFQFERGEMSNRFEQRKKQTQDLTLKCDSIQKEAENAQAEVFRKQSELINLENKYQEKIQQL